MDINSISSSEFSDFKLGQWWVRPQSNELERADTLERVEARSMAVLVCLARSAPRLVSKDRLVAEVWHDAPFVGDDVLSHAIWELRRALGDSARDSAYIETVPRKGYRLIAEVLRPQGSPIPIEGARIAHYDLQDEVGNGAMGVVFKAVDRRLGRTVAVKFLASELTRDLEACRRFEREARLAASLDHPNIATVHGIGETSQGYRYLVSSYYGGGSLKDRLGRGPVELDDAVRLTRQLLSGLAAAHRRGIVHRDVKPANLMIDDHGTLKICDFGIAKLLGATDLTRTGAPLGTPAYKSPEQTEGEAVDQRTDLWSVGVVLFELLTGRRPFGGEYEHALARSILSKAPRPLVGVDGRPVPEPLRRLVVRALAKNPAERFQSAGAMAAELDSLEKGSILPEASPGKRNRKVVAAGTLIPLGALLLFLALRQWEMGGLPPERSGEGWDHVTQGRTLWLRGNHQKNLEEVRSHFESALALMPDSAEAHGSLAIFLAERFALNGDGEDRDAAQRLIEETLVLDPESSLARSADAWLLLLEERVEDGERRAREAIEISPTCDRDEICDLAYVWLAEALWMQRRPNAADATLEEGIGQGGGNIRCRLKRAQLSEKQGKPRKAEAAYLEVLALDQNQTTALNDLALYYFEESRFREAIPLLRRFYKATQDPRASSNLGYALYARELWDESIKAYQEADRGYRDRDERNPTARMAIGDIQLELGERILAQENYRQALAIFEAIEDAKIYQQAQHAVCLAKLDLFDAAEAKIVGLLGRVDDVPDLLVYAARVYALMGNREVLFDLARKWVEGGRPSSRFLDDPAMIPYRKDPAFLNILEPELIPAP